MGLTEVPWGDLTPEKQEWWLKVQRAFLEDPDWFPPEGWTATVITVPAGTWDELFDE